MLDRLKFVAIRNSEVFAPWRLLMYKVTMSICALKSLHYTKLSVAGRDHYWKFHCTFIVRTKFRRKIKKNIKHKILLECNLKLFGHVLFGKQARVCVLLCTKNSQSSSRTTGYLFSVIALCNC